MSWSKTNGTVAYFRHGRFTSPSPILTASCQIYSTTLLSMSSSQKWESYKTIFIGRAERETISTIIYERKSSMEAIFAKQNRAFGDKRGREQNLSFFGVRPSFRPQNIREVRSAGAKAAPKNGDKFSFHHNFTNILIFNLWKWKKNQ